MRVRGSVIISSIESVGLETFLKIAPEEKLLIDAAVPLPEYLSLREGGRPKWSRSFYCSNGERESRLGEAGMSGYILSIDQGTTGTTILIFDHEVWIKARAYSEFTQHYPRPGWVEHDATEIWKITIFAVAEALRKAGIRASDLRAIGITNQRETVVVWDRRTRQPVHNAIVWQDRRTAQYCDEVRAHDGLDDKIRGLHLEAARDPRPIGRWRPSPMMPSRDPARSLIGCVKKQNCTASSHFPASTSSR